CNSSRHYHDEPRAGDFLDGGVHILGIKSFPVLEPDAQHPSVRARGTLDLQLERWKSRGGITLLPQLILDPAPHVIHAWSVSFSSRILSMASGNRSVPVVKSLRMCRFSNCSTCSR